MPILNRTFRLGPLENNSYVIVCEASREAAVVDVGFESEVIVRALRGMDVHVRFLLNTHAHYDHVAGMRDVQLACGGEYWLHPLDRPLLDILAEQAAEFDFPPAEPPAEVHDLSDRQRLALGEVTLEVIHTPGHSPGGVCFHLGDDLWAGDTLFAGSIGRTDLPGGSFSDLARSIRTRLFPLGDAVRVHTGHFDATTIGEEKRHNPYVGVTVQLA
jgi:hydroxyacylglutathione hydrolase